MLLPALPVSSADGSIPSGRQVNRPRSRPRSMDCFRLRASEPRSRLPAAVAIAHRLGLTRSQSLLRSMLSNSALSIVIFKISFPTANGLVRQGSSLVVDAFSTPCQVGTPHLDSVVRSKSLITPWNCALEGSGKAYNVNTTNFAPRLGFAWSPRNGNTVVRGSAGVFYDQLPTSYIAQLLKNRPTPLNFNDPSAIIGQNFLTTGCPGGSPSSQCGLGNSSLNPATLTPAQLANFQFNQAASGAPAIYGIDVKHSKTPYSMQVSGSVQQQLGRNFTGEVGYVGAFGYNQPVIYNAEFQNEWFCITSSNSGGQSRCDTFSYFPIFTSTNRGGSDYNSMMLRLRAAQFHGLRLNA